MAPGNVGFLSEAGGQEIAEKLHQGWSKGADSWVFVLGVETKKYHLYTVPSCTSTKKEPPQCLFEDFWNPPLFLLKRYQFEPFMQATFLLVLRYQHHINMLAVLGEYLQLWDFFDREAIPAQGTQSHGGLVQNDFAFKQMG